jgi:RNA polymerase sigma factor (sigma-70 family)
MDGKTLDTMLERLNSGDAAAIENAFLTYEPYLRMMVRRQLSAPLRARFDSADIVQSVWARLLLGLRGGRWYFADAAHLRGFLVTAARNHFLNRAGRACLARQQALAGADQLPSPQPGPHEVAQADELWERMVELCPLAHRELLRLKREGLPLAEIAARTGLHESSVRRILYDLARCLAVTCKPSPGEG